MSQSGDVPLHPLTTVNAEGRWPRDVMPSRRQATKGMVGINRKARPLAIDCTTKTDVLSYTC